MRILIGHPRQSVIEFLAAWAHRQTIYPITSAIAKSKELGPEQILSPEGHQNHRLALKSGNKPLLPTVRQDLGQLHRAIVEPGNRLLFTSACL